MVLERKTMTKTAAQKSRETRDRRKADRLCSSNTGFASFQDLLDAKGSYRPSIDVREPDMLWLADYYDRAQEARGDARRAYRYGQPKPGTKTAKVRIQGQKSIAGFVVRAIYVNNHKVWDTGRFLGTGPDELTLSSIMRDLSKVPAGVLKLFGITQAKQGGLVILDQEFLFQDRRLHLFQNKLWGQNFHAEVAL